MVGMKKLLSGIVFVTITCAVNAQQEPSIEWQKCFGGSSYDQAFSILETSDGGFIVAGGSLSNDGDVSGNHGGGDYWIVKLDSAGSIEWQKSLGGSEDEVAYSIQEASDGGFI